MTELKEIIISHFNIREEWDFDKDSVKDLKVFIKEAEKSFQIKKSKKNKILFLLTEISQNIIKHKSENDLFLGIIKKNNILNIYSANFISECNKDNIKSEIKLMQNNADKNLKDIVKKRISSFDVKGTGLLQIYLKSSHNTDFNIIEKNNKIIFLTKTSLYV